MTMVPVCSGVIVVMAGMTGALVSMPVFGVLLGIIAGAVMAMSVISVTVVATVAVMVVMTVLAIPSLLVALALCLLGG